MKTIRLLNFFFFFFIYNIKFAISEKSIFNYLRELSFNESYERLFEKCFEIPSTFCLGDTSNIVTSHSTHNGLIGKWTFDDFYALDYSSNKNHMHKFIKNGPSFNGHGSSGAFIGDVSGFVSASESLKITNFTIIFWIYLLERSISHFRNIFSQIDNENQQIAILLHPHVSKLSVRVIGKNNTYEGLSSIGNVLLRRWTNVAITLNQNKIEIYLNGVFDNSVYIKNESIEKSGSITVGKNTYYSGFNGYLDELYFYNRDLSFSEIKSFSLSSITGIYDTDFVYVGSLSCDYNTAKSSNLCKKEYQLCSLFDLYNGSIHYARVNGILTEKSNLWASDVSEDTIEQGEKRIALCCKERYDIV